MVSPPKAKRSDTCGVRHGRSLVGRVRTVGRRSRASPGGRRGKRRAGGDPGREVLGGKPVVSLPKAKRRLAAERVGAGNDFQDLLGDLGLAGAVHGQRQAVDQLPAAFEAFRIAVMRAPCSEAADSRSAR